MPDKISASVYLVIEPTRRYGNPIQVREFAIREMRKNKPNLRGGELAVKVRLNLDPSLFDEYIPVLDAFIEGHDIIVPTVEVLPSE